MAEALYPEEPPPSYESQFHFTANHRTRMNASHHHSSGSVMRRCMLLETGPAGTMHDRDSVSIGSSLQPLPSAPPLSHPHPERPHLQDRTNTMTPPPVATPRKAYKKVVIPQHEPIPEKSDLSSGAAQPQRVPKRPPPPPPSQNHRTSRPQGNSRKPRPQSSIQLGSYQHTGMPHVHSDTCTAELDSFGHPRRQEPSNGISTSVYDITDPYNMPCQHFQRNAPPQQLQHSITPQQFQESNPTQHFHHNNAPPQVHMAEEEFSGSQPLNQPHLYESLHLLNTPSSNGQYASPRTINETTHPQGNFTRQISAPSPARRRYRRVSMPPEAYARSESLPGDVVAQHPNNTQTPPNSYPQPSHISQQFVQSSLHNGDAYSGSEMALARPSTFPQSDTPTTQPQPVQVVQPFRPHIQTQPQLQRSFSEQAGMTGAHPHVHGHSMEVAVRPLPKPRSLVTPTEQMVQPLALSMQGLPVSAPVLPMTSISQQHNTTQYTTTQQQLTTLPGHTQVQTYSFAQQASVVTIPGIVQSPGQMMTSGSPTVVNISPTFPPGQMSMPMLTQEPALNPVAQNMQQRPLDGEATVQRYGASSPSASDNVHRASATSGSVAVTLGSSPDLSAKPVPKPRRLRNQSSDAELLEHGLEAGLESAESDVGLVARGGGDTGDMEDDTGLVDEPEISETQMIFRLEDDQVQNEANEQQSEFAAQSASIVQDSAPVKPPRRHVRKPPPPPPNGRARHHSAVSTSSQPEPVTNPASSDIATTAVSDQEGEPEETTVSVQPVSPSGYKIKDVFFNGNIIFLLPLSDPLRLPLRTSGRSLRGKGTFKNDCKFEIVYLSSAIGHEQTVLVIMLKCFSRMNRYLAINRKGKVKVNKGAAEKCKFVVREVTDRPLLRYGVVTLESAIYPGWFLTVTSGGKTRKCDSSRPPVRVDESKFAVRIERIFNAYSSPLTSIATPSVVNQLRDRSIIQLELKSLSRFLCVDFKGRLQHTGNKGDVTTHFIVFDRGMGVFSLRSNKMAKMWLRVGQSKIQGQVKPDLAADFRITETPDGSVQFESIVSPGIFLAYPPEQTDRSGSPPERNFTVRHITK